MQRTASQAEPAEYTLLTDTIKRRLESPAPDNDTDKTIPEHETPTEEEDKAKKHIPEVKKPKEEEVEAKKHIPEVKKPKEEVKAKKQTAEVKAAKEELVKKEKQATQDETVKEEASKAKKPTQEAERSREATPEAEKSVEFRRSKIPLARYSPVPIRREIQNGGGRARSISAERKPATTPVTPTTDDATTTAKSTTSDDATTKEATITSVATVTSAVTVTKTTPVDEKGSSTFNLSRDSDLFTQISDNKLQSTQTETFTEESKPDACHVVEVTSHEIVKSNVTDETTAVDLGPTPRTFVVEVKTLEQRMRPTLGVLKRKSDAEVGHSKHVKVAGEQHEYLILDQDRPQQAERVTIATDEPADDDVMSTEAVDSKEEEVVSQKVAVVEKMVSSGGDEGIYSEVEEPPQVRVVVTFRDGQGVMMRTQ